MKINQHFFFTLLVILSAFVGCQSNDQQGGLKFDYERHSSPLTLEVEYLKKGGYDMEPNAFIFRTTFKNISPDTVHFGVMSCSYGSDFIVEPREEFRVVKEVCWQNLALRVELPPNDTYENSLGVCLREKGDSAYSEKIKIGYKWMEHRHFMTDSASVDSTIVWAEAVSLTPKNDFDWNSKKPHFPQKNLTVFDFDSDRTPINQVEGLPKLDSAFARRLVSQVPHYQRFQEYIELYYFSLNEFADAENEVGIFLATIDFDGLEYCFDMIQFDANGAVITYKTLATSWTAAECFGYTRAFIDPDSLILTNQKVQKCYNEAIRGFEVTDSSVTKSALEIH